jgi:argininosuccinate lyase
MAENEGVTLRHFVEGIGGRLAAPKGKTYTRAVLDIESRNNPFIARYMLAGDLACVLSARELDITPKPEADKLIRCLIELLPRAEELAREKSIGDIVVSRELWVSDVVGKDAGAWLHVGRNRAESLRGSLPRMCFRDILWRQNIALQQLVGALVDKAEPNLEALAPFYHHLQHAGRTSLGEYLLSFATNFATHFDRIAAADKHLDLAPPPNSGREIVVELINRVGKRLGFTRVGKLWQELFITEEFFSEPFFTSVQIAVALARLAEDLRLYMTSEFAFFELADEHASGSSGRPQKKNPFGLQMIINGAAVGAGRLAAQFATNITVSEEADSTYHAYQLYEFGNDVIAWTEFMADVIAKGEFKLGELETKSAMGFAGAREALDVLVYEHGVPYRFGHRVCGELVRLASSGMQQPELVAQMRSRLQEFPKIDVEALVRIALGESTEAILLNVPAFKSALGDLRTRLGALERSAVPNPVDTAIERMTAEGEAILAAAAA